MSTVEHTGTSAADLHAEIAGDQKRAEQVAVARGAARRRSRTSSFA